MGIKDSYILVGNNGEVQAPKRYIYIQPSLEDGELSYELKMDCGIGDLLNATFLLWEAIKEEAQDLSDQEIYELCGDFDLDYSLFKRQMRGDYDEED